MTLEELQSDEALRNREFPVTREKIFLAHAGVCPLPRRVHVAMSGYSELCTQTDQEFALPHAWLSETRRLVADFIGAKPEETAFVGPTSLALSFMAEGLKVRRNQNVLVYQDDYPSNVYPWMTLANRGVQVRFLNIRDYGCIRARDVIGQVDENTRMVALASCHFISGYRIDIEEIGRELKERGIAFFLDGIQTLGAFPTSLEYVDAMAADAHKWLLGPCGAGIMFVRESFQDQIRPIVHGWHNLKCPNYVALDDLEYRAGARRYEAGSHNITGIAGLRAGIELLLEIGLERIGRDLLQKHQWLNSELRSRGYSVLAANAPEKNCGGMISFYKPGTDISEVYQRLQENRIITSLRTDRRNQRYIRISPHFYNTQAELERTVTFL